MRRGLYGGRGPSARARGGHRAARSRACRSRRPRAACSARRSVSARTLPPADCSAMDGYAVRAADLAGGLGRQPAGACGRFEVAAGGPRGRQLGPGEAARIFTGAPMPPGADAVVRQEDVEREGARVRVRVARARRARTCGAPAKTCAQATRARPQGPRSAPRSSACSRRSAAARSPSTSGRASRSSRAATSWSRPDGDPAGGRIVSSNSYSLAAQCREAGAEPIYLGIARDTPEELERRARARDSARTCSSARRASRSAIATTCGPCSRSSAATLVFWGVEIKPGFPLVFGRFGETRAAGLRPARAIRSRRW